MSPMQPREDATTPTGPPPLQGGVLGDPSASPMRSDAAKRRAMHAAMAAAVRALRSTGGRVGRRPPGGLL
jgi:hypothetical protein